MAYVNGELAIYRLGLIEFRDPVSGILSRTIPAPGSIEGLAFDGIHIWTLSANIVGIDPADGSVVVSLPNAAGSCGFDGTGITASGDFEPTLACTDRRWFIVSSLDGSVIQ